MKIKVSHEAPIPYIKYCQTVTDFDFTIAHYALENEKYMRKYKNRAQERMLILDNGLFELGKPLPLGDVFAVADELAADYIIPPDHTGNFAETRFSLTRYLERNLGYKTAPVVVGSSVEELVRCYEWYKTLPEVDMYCWSFLTPRAEALKLCQIDKTKPHHFLGMDTVAELKECVQALGMETVSVDTSKPFSASFQGRALEDLGRGAYERFGIGDTIRDTTLLLANIKIFQGWMQRIEEELSAP